MALQTSHLNIQLDDGVFRFWTLNVSTLTIWEFIFIPKSMRDWKLKSFSNGFLVVLKMFRVHHLSVAFTHKYAQ